MLQNSHMPSSADPCVGVLWACSERAFVPSGYRATVLLAGKKDNLRSAPCIGHQLHGPPER